jgi:hypothetical protein
MQFCSFAVLRTGDFGVRRWVFLVQCCFMTNNTEQGTLNTELRRFPTAKRQNCITFKSLSSDSKSLLDYSQ